MEETASGLILRTRPLTETSLIVEWLTAELGRLSTVAKGARRPKSPFLGKLDLFYEADFSFARSRRSELHNLREVRLREVHPKLRQDLTRLNAASYCAILLEQGTERETPLPEFFELAKDFLKTLDQHPPGASLVFALEIKLLQLSGMDAEPGTLSAPGKQLLAGLRIAPLKEAARLQLMGALYHEISAVLRRSIGAMLERLPIQRERLLQSLLGALPP